MSKILKAFEDLLFQGNGYKKLFVKQTPGKRIVPVQAKDNDAKYQLRLDAGEGQTSIKKVYLQVNSQAKNEALKKYKSKHGTHANLATGTINEDTPDAEQEQAARALWNSLAEQANNNLK